MIVGVALVVDELHKGQRLAFRYPESVPLEVRARSDCAGLLKLYNQFFSLSHETFAKLFRPKNAASGRIFEMYIDDIHFVCFPSLLPPEGTSTNTTSGQGRDKDFSQWDGDVDETTSMREMGPSADATNNNKSEEGEKITFFNIVIATASLRAMNNINPNILLKCQSKLSAGAVGADPIASAIGLRQEINCICKAVLRRVVEAVSKCLLKQEKTARYVTDQVSLIMRVIDRCVQLQGAEPGGLTFGRTIGAGSSASNCGSSSVPASFRHAFASSPPNLMMQALSTAPADTRSAAADETMNDGSTRRDHDEGRLSTAPEMLADVVPQTQHTIFGYDPSTSSGSFALPAPPILIRTVSVPVATQPVSTRTRRSLSNSSTSSTASNNSMGTGTGPPLPSAAVSTSSTSSYGIGIAADASAPHSARGNSGGAHPESAHHLSRSFDVGDAADMASLVANRAGGGLLDKAPSNRSESNNDPLRISAAGLPQTPQHSNPSSSGSNISSSSSSSSGSSSSGSSSSTYTGGAQQTSSAGSLFSPASAGQGSGPGLGASLRAPLNSGLGNEGSNAAGGGKSGISGSSAGSSSTGGATVGGSSGGGDGFSNDYDMRSKWSAEVLNSVLVHSQLANELRVLYHSLADGNTVNIRFNGEKTATISLACKDPRSCDDSICNLLGKSNRRKDSIATCSKNPLIRPEAVLLELGNQLAAAGVDFSVPPSRITAAPRPMIDSATAASYSTHSASSAAITAPTRAAGIDVEDVDSLGGCVPVPITITNPISNSGADLDGDVSSSVGTASTASGKLVAGTTAAPPSTSRASAAAPSSAVSTTANIVAMLGRIYGPSHNPFADTSSLPSSVQPNCSAIDPLSSITGRVRPSRPQGQHRLMKQGQALSQAQLQLQRQRQRQCSPLHRQKIRGISPTTQTMLAVADACTIMQILASLESSSSSSHPPLATALAPAPAPPAAQHRPHVHGDGVAGATLSAPPSVSTAVSISTFAPSVMPVLNVGAPLGIATLGPGSGSMPIPAAKSGHDVAQGCLTSTATLRSSVASRADLLLGTGSLLLPRHKYQTDSRLFKFVAAVDPTLSFFDLSLMLDEPLEELLSMANTLQSWGLAEIISTLYGQSCYKVHPHAPLARDSPAARAFEAFLLEYDVDFSATDTVAEGSEANGGNGGNEGNEGGADGGGGGNGRGGVDRDNEEDPFDSGVIPLADVASPEPFRSKILTDSPRRGRGVGTGTGAARRGGSEGKRSNRMSDSKQDRDVGGNDSSRADPIGLDGFGLGKAISVRSLGLFASNRHLSYPPNSNPTGFLPPSPRGIDTTAPFDHSQQAPSFSTSAKIGETSVTMRSPHECPNASTTPSASVVPGASAPATVQRLPYLLERTALPANCSLVSVLSAFDGDHSFEDIASKHFAPALRPLAIDITVFLLRWHLIVEVNSYIENCLHIPFYRVELREHLLARSSQRRQGSGSRGKARSRRGTDGASRGGSVMSGACGAGLMKQSNSSGNLNLNLYSGRNERDAVGCVDTVSDNNKSSGAQQQGEGRHASRSMDAGGGEYLPAVSLPSHIEDYRRGGLGIAAGVNNSVVDLTGQQARTRESSASSSAQQQVDERTRRKVLIDGLKDQDIMRSTADLLFEYERRLSRTERSIYERLVPYVQNIVSSRSIHEILLFEGMDKTELRSVILKLPFRKIVKKIAPVV